MSLDLATIGIAMETSGLEKGTTALKNTEAAANKTADAADKLSGRMDLAGSSIKSMAAAFTVAGIATKGLELALNQVGTAMNYAMDSAKLAARYETLGVVMNVVGRNAGYTSMQMMEASKGVQAMGITMMESRDSVVKMASAQIDLINATKLARVAQDAAVIGGINSSEALKSMVYGIQSGQTEVLRTIGINVSFEQSYKKLATQIGTTSESLSEQEKITARTNAVLESGTKIAGVYEDAMGTAGKQMTSLARYSEDAQVKLGAVFNESMLLAIATYTGHLKDSNAGLDELTRNKSLETWSRDMASTLAFLADSAKNSFAVITGTLDTVYTAMLQVSRFTVGDYKGVVDAGKGYSSRMGDRIDPNNQMQVQLENLRSKRDSDAKTLVMPDKSVIRFDTPEQKTAYQNGLGLLKKSADDRLKVMDAAGEATTNAMRKHMTTQQKVEDELQRYRKTQTAAGIDLNDPKVKAAEAAIRSRDKSGGKGAAAAERDIFGEQIQAFKNVDKQILDGRQDFNTDMGFLIKLGQKTNLQAISEGLDDEFNVWMKRSGLLNQELEILKTKKNSQKDQTAVMGKLADVSRDYEQAQRKAQGEIKVILNEVSIAYNEAEFAARTYMDVTNRQYGRNLDGIGQGRQVRDRRAGITQIEDKYGQQLQQVESDKIRGKYNGKDDLLKEDLERINRFQSESLSSYETYYEKLTSEQGNWQAGASEALKNYATETSNVFKQTENLVTKAFGGMEDALVKFATTGKLDFKSLADSIISDLIRMQIQQSITKPLASGGLGGLVGSLFGTAGQAGLANAMPGDSLDNFIGLAGLAGARASGGPVSGGSSYLVGELGPEIFTPSGGGSITPNNQLGGNKNIALTNNITVAGGVGAAEVYQAVNRAIAENNRQWSEQLKRQGVLA